MDPMHRKEGSYSQYIWKVYTFQYMDSRNGHRFPTEVQLQHAATETRTHTNTDKTTEHSAIHEQTLYGLTSSI